MIEIKNNRDLRRLRRHALAAQGLLQKRPFGSGLAGASNAIRQLGYVQIDTISVVERAHHHVLYSRVPGFTPAMTNALLCSGDIFEYWAHAAAFLPMADYRYSLPYKQAVKDGQVHWFKHRDTRLMKALLARIRAEGPLKSRDLENPRKKSAGWWDWKPAKKALEHLYMQGDLMISDREGFQKTYDLTERVLPAGVDSSMPDIEEQAAYLLAQHLRSHAVVALKAVTHLRRNAALREAVKTLVNEKIQRHELEPLRVNNGAMFICEAGLLDRSPPRVSDRLSILSPFDNSLIHRQRLDDLFQYSYQLECYLPEARRRYGYFSLPLLYRDAFIGRMDCKVHRKAARLEVRSLHFEAGQQNEPAVQAALDRALTDFARFQGCETVSTRNRVLHKL